MSDNISELGEHGLIERIRSRVPSAPNNVILGIGDDAAVIDNERGQVFVVSTDALVEGTHFTRQFNSAADIGHKALAVNLSDLAAMGAQPHHALLSLILPQATTTRDVDDLVDGFLTLASTYSVALIGGNISAIISPSPSALVIDVTVIGSVKKRRILTRSRARPGDIIFVSGAIGTAAAGLASLQTTYKQKIIVDGNELAIPVCQQHFQRPSPRVALGLALSRNRAAHACIDLSDGFGDAIHQLTSASEVGACIEAEALPIIPEAQNWFARQDKDPLIESISGGEDYELVFTAPPSFRGRLAHVKRQVKNIAITAVGVITKERQVLLRRNGVSTSLPNGFEHFSELNRF
tara:strand:+ start:1469 stop:2518 length:1050 start_codon:yes stop_codon:yes gene_type:complete